MATTDQMQFIVEGMADVMKTVNEEQLLELHETVFDGKPEQTLLYIFACLVLSKEPQEVMQYLNVSEIAALWIGSQLLPFVDLGDDGEIPQINFNRHLH